MPERLSLCGVTKLEKRNNLSVNGIEKNIFWWLTKKLLEGWAGWDGGKGEVRGGRRVPGRLCEVNLGAAAAR